MGARGRYDAGVTPFRSSRPDPAANDRRDPSGAGARGARERRRRPGRRAGPGGPGVPQAGGGALPGWVTEELARVTPRQRVPAAAEELEEAAVAFVDGRFAKARASRRRGQGAGAASAGDSGDPGVWPPTAWGAWEEALTELRTYRRLSGDTTHLPVEMDVLRALDRPEEVEAAHALLRRLGGSPAALAEGRVLFLKGAGSSRSLKIRELFSTANWSFLHGESFTGYQKKPFTFYLCWIQDKMLKISS